MARRPAPVSPSGAGEICLAPTRVSMQWIVGPGVDLIWLIGGAAAGYGFYLLHARLHVDMLQAWVVWFALLDSPHFFGTYSRTYLDRDERWRRGALLLGSLALFAIGPVVLLFSVALYALGLPFERLPLLLLVSSVNLWAYWHVVRQHYGVLALYQRKNDDLDPLDRRIDRLALHVGLLAPFVAFLVRHPETRAALGLPPQVADSSWEAAVVGVSIAAVALAAAVFAARQAQRWREGQPLDGPKILLLLAVVPLHMTVCYGDATLDAPLLGFAAFVTIFHNLQYHALVRFYHRNRYGGAGALERYGVAARVNRSFWTYARSAVAMGIGFAAAGCLFGVTPGCVPFVESDAIRLYGGVTLRDALFAGVFVGFLMHHYLLDQFIWRPSSDELLRGDLGLDAAAGRWG